MGQGAGPTDAPPPPSCGVLVVSADGDLTEHAAAFLERSTGFTLAASVTDAEAALRAISVRRDVAAVLVDAEAARDLAPAIARRLGTVVAARRPSVDDYKAAMAARAIDVLDVPLSAEALETALSDAAARTRSHDAPNGALVVVTAPKGGCGVTTLVVHLAHRVRESGASVCIVELGEPDGGVKALLHSAWSDRPPVAEVLADGQDMSDDQLRAATAPGGGSLGVLSGPAANGESPVDARALATLLWRLETLYDVVLVDAGAAPGSFARNGLADRVVLVVTPDWQCVAAASAQLELSDEGPLVVVNRAARADDLQPQSIASLLKRSVARAVLPECFGDLQRGAHAGDPARVQSAEWNAAVAALSSDLELVTRSS